ncbi:methyltransferase domain-containing protein [candidate division WOR-3 bacterium]|nr:methyltransferase domain-containing protein [candidate division WOR-3 bacterium]
MEPQPGPFDALADEYDSWYDGKGRMAFEIELAALRPLLAGLPKPWLEVGVGTGRFAQALGIPQGVDPSPGLLEKARARGIDVLYGEGEELVFRAGSFGTVFLLTTWAFLGDPLIVLRECRRVLADDGRLVNAYLDRDGKWGSSYAERGQQGHPLFSYAHFDRYEYVKRLTERAGFEVISTVSTLFQGPGETVALEEPRPGFVRGASFVVVVARPAT